MFEVNNRNTKKRCQICSKLTIKTPERSQWRCSGVFIDNFEHISHFFLVAEFDEQAHVSWLYAGLANAFLTNAPILYPLKTLESHFYSCLLVFRKPS